MLKAEVAKLFQNGNSQAVRLPQEFRFDGDRVRIRRVSQGVLLEPIVTDLNEWFRRLDGFKSGSLLPEREQPITPSREIFK